ncbi:MAG TPA: PatA/PatG family cyanobactin maturation protease [Phormidium sp.]
MRILGLQNLWIESLGSPEICIAILDGPVDQSHQCFEGANLTRLPTLVSDTAGSGHMSGHGTHITSVIFGQPSSAVHGIAPGCRGLIVPVFSDSQRGSLSQLDLARAINQAVENGANIINISGGQLSQSGEADPILSNAVKACNDNGVLIVAAAGNDACQCLHVPAALPSVLAVGAMNAQGLPFDFSNWGSIYQTQGILALGENILGAVPDGQIAYKSGTSFATPIVSGIVALLLSLQLKQGEIPNPYRVRDAILESVLPCNPEVATDCRQFLAGSLNIPGAHALIAKGKMKEQMSDDNVSQPNITNSLASDGVQATNAAPQEATIPFLQPTGNGMVYIPAASTPNGMYFVPNMHGMGTYMVPHASGSAIVPSQFATPQAQLNGAANTITTSDITASEACGCNGNGTTSLVYALGLIGYDFGTEARRDSFKQLMPAVDIETGLPIPPSDSSSTSDGLRTTISANPFDARQMAHYLQSSPSEATSLIWTLNLELNPIYAIEPKGAFAADVYRLLQEFLDGQVRDERDIEYVERVSIPAVMTGKTVTLFSGQTVPVIEPVNTRGMYAWKVRSLINAVLEQAAASASDDLPSEQRDLLREHVEHSLESFLLRIYYDLRNLGQTSQERALNYAATNAFQFTNVLATALRKRSAASDNNQIATMQLDTFEVERSPFCRMDSDCWDVKIKFFDPDNDRRAKTVVRYTIDVSDIMPVTLGQARMWQVPN